MVNERGLDVHHVTVYRWVQDYAPELDKRCRPYLRPTNDLWRVDETYIEVKGKSKYLYRAVDSVGNTLDFLLSAKRDAAAAKRFFRKTLKAIHTSSPRVITVDKNAAYPKAIDELKQKRELLKQVKLRQKKYLNNIVEQDNRGTIYCLWFKQAITEKQKLNEATVLTSLYWLAQLPAMATCEEKSVTTIKGLAKGDELHPVQAAFIKHDGFQCGYCTPGQICSAVALMNEAKNGEASYITADVRQQPRSIQLSDDEIRERMSGNICRCGAYPNIIAAIQEVHTAQAQARQIAGETDRAMFEAAAIAAIHEES